MSPEEVEDLDGKLRALWSVWKEFWFSGAVVDDARLRAALLPFDHDGFSSITMGQLRRIMRDFATRVRPNGRVFAPFRWYGADRIIRGPERAAAGALAQLTCDCKAKIGPLQFGPGYEVALRAFFLGATVEVFQ